MDSAGAASCSCEIGFLESDGGVCAASSALPSYDDVAKWVADYKAVHPGNGGKDWDINAKSAAEVAKDPAAQKLLALCHPNQRPVIPLIAWEYGGVDHPWINPQASPLVFCVYVPANPSTAHWSFAANHVIGDVYVLYPDKNPCKGNVGAEQVSKCIGDTTNFEILVDTASLHDGSDVGLALTEASTELKLIPPGGGPSIHLFSNL